MASHRVNLMIGRCSDNSYENCLIIRVKCLYRFMAVQGPIRFVRRRIRQLRRKTERNDNSRRRKYIS